MVQSISAQLGLLAFAVAVIAGLHAGNSAAAILTRALLALLVGATLGRLVAGCAKRVLRDHLLRKKLVLDREHVAAVQQLTLETEGPEPTEDAEPQEVA
jgi:hypothetical protein